MHRDQDQAATPHPEGVDPLLSPWMVDNVLRKRRCQQLAQDLVQRVINLDLGIREGAIRSHMKPYRRLDCSGRAIAYVRLRPRNGGLRVDIPGTWRPPEDCALSVNGANSAASLFVREFEEVDLAVRFLRETVLRSRERWVTLEARSRARVVEGDRAAAYPLALPAG